MSDTNSPQQLKKLIQLCEANDIANTQRALTDLGDTHIIRDIFLSQCSHMNLLFVAASLGHASIVDLILKAGQQAFSSRSSSSSTSSKTLHMQRHFLRTDQGVSPLAIAIQNGHFAVVKIFIKYIENQNAENDDKNNNNKAFFFSALLGTMLNDEDFDGHSPLSIAISEQHLQIIKLLIPFVDSNGYYHQQTNNNGKPKIQFSDKRFATHLWHAVSSGDFDVVKLLLTSPSLDVDIPSLYGTTPLMMCCSKGRRSILRELLFPSRKRTASIPDVFKIDLDGRHCLHHACQSDHSDIVQLVLVDFLIQNRKFEANTLQNFLNHRDKNGDTALMVASKVGSAECVQVILSAVSTLTTIPASQISFLQNTNSGMTALAIACSQGHLDVVEVILEYCCSASALSQQRKRDGEKQIQQPQQYDLMMIADKNNSTPLHIAATRNFPEIISRLLDAATISSEIFNALDGKGFSPLYVACANGCTAAVQALLAEQSLVDPFFTNLGKNADDDVREGTNCLFVTCEKGFVDILSILLQQQRMSEKLQSFVCMDPFSSKMRRQSDNCTPLAIAAQNGHDEIVQILLMRARSKSLEVRMKLRSQTMRKAKITKSKVLLSLAEQEENEFFAEEDENEETKRLKAEAQHEHEDEALIDSIPPDFTDAQILQRILDFPSDDDATPVYRAADGNQPSTIQLLVSGGCHPDLQTSRGWTPLMVAVYRGHLECVRELLMYASTPDIEEKDFDVALLPSVNVNAVLDTSGASCLHLACSTKELASHKDENSSLQQDQYDDFGASSPHRSRINEQLVREEIIRLLLRFGANVNATTSPANVTPLFFAAQNGHMECCRTLIEFGADTTVKTSKGFTALDAARNCSHEDVVHFLELFENQLQHSKQKQDENQKHRLQLEEEIALLLDHMEIGIIEEIFAERERLAGVIVKEMEDSFTFSALLQTLFSQREELAFSIHYQKNRLLQQSILTVTGLTKTFSHLTENFLPNLEQLASDHLFEMTMEFLNTCASVVERDEKEYLRIFLERNAVVLSRTEIEANFFHTKKEHMFEEKVRKPVRL